MGRREFDYTDVSNYFHGGRFDSNELDELQDFIDGFGSKKKKMKKRPYR